MADTARILIGTPLPPLLLPSRRPRPIRPDDVFARLGRVACVLAALALPALGIAVADTVHRSGEPRAMQAAAPVGPSDRAAAPAAVARSARAIAAGPTEIPSSEARP